MPCLMKKSPQHMRRRVRDLDSALKPEAALLPAMKSGQYIVTRISLAIDSIVFPALVARAAKRLNYHPDSSPYIRIIQSLHII